MNETEPMKEDEIKRLLALPRGQERLKNHYRIILAILNIAGPQSPTRDQLQKLTRIRRKRFIEVLRYLMHTRSVVRFGDGTKESPFRYRLPSF
jgi:hypothetical protein